MIYQIVWQRSLYAIFGINIESVTIVVTAFLAGLGLGSLLGGELSRRYQRLVLLFGAAEFFVGVYGFFSLQLFRWLGFAGAEIPETVSALVTLVLLLPPTLLMGMTLPLLVAHGVRTSHSTGTTVGWLYFANTIGSACAALAAVMVIMPILGEQGSVNLAATLNLVVAGTVVFKFRDNSPIPA